MKFFLHVISKSISNTIRVIQKWSPETITNGVKPKNLQE